MKKPHWHEIDAQKSYILSGKRLKDLLRRSTDVHGMIGQIDILEEPDGGVTIGIASQRVCYIIANGAPVKVIMPIVVVAE